MARLVLSDAGPLIALARLDGLPWLTELFGLVHVTPEVLAEILTKRGGTDEVLLEQALNFGVLEPLGTSPATPAYPHLGDGEASCLRVAAAASAPPLIILDDRLARREAARVEIPIVGVAAIIGRAELRGLIPSAAVTLAKLLQTDYRIGKNVVDEVLAWVDSQRAS